MKFNAIKTKEPGIAIIFLDKQHLNSITDKPMLQMARANTPCQVVINIAGHGGHDIGAAGFFNLKEKDLTLSGF